MRKSSYNLKHLPLTLIYLIILVFLGTFLQPNYTIKAESLTEVSYSSSVQAPLVGQEFVVSVNAANIADLYGASIDIKYDPTLFQITAIENGDLVKSASIINPVNTNINGIFSYAFTLAGPVSGLTGTSSNIFKIRIKPLKAGNIAFNTISDNSDLTLTNNIRLKLSNSQAMPISYTKVNNTFTINDPALTTVEDNSSYINYIGSWSATATSKYSNIKDSYIFSRFSGTSFKWIGTKYSNRGIARVDIDNGKYVYTVDCYSASIQTNASLLDVTNLPDANHSVKIYVTGTKNVSATNTVIDIDKFIVARPVKFILVENTDSALVYNGSWNFVSGLSYTNSQTSSVSLNFTGRTLIIRGNKFTNRGISKIDIDNGKYIYYVDSYSATALYSQVLFEKNDLNEGNHIVTISVSPNKNPSSTNTYIDVDQIFLEGLAPLKTYGIYNTQIKYVGTWTKNGDLAYSNITGSYISFTFQGSKLIWTGNKFTNRGIARIDIDNGTYIYDVDNYSLTPKNNEILFQKSDLPSGTHTVKIYVTGSKNSASTNTVVDLKNLTIQY